MRGGGGPIAAEELAGGGLTHWTAGMRPGEMGGDGVASGDGGGAGACRRQKLLLSCLDTG